MALAMQKEHMRLQYEQAEKEYKARQDQIDYEEQLRREREVSDCTTQWGWRWACFAKKIGGVQSQAGPCGLDEQLRREREVCVHAWTLWQLAVGNCSVLRLGNCPAHM